MVSAPAIWPNARRNSRRSMAGALTTGLPCPRPRGGRRRGSADRARSGRRCRSSRRRCRRPAASASPPAEPHRMMASGGAWSQGVVWGSMSAMNAALGCFACAGVLFLAASPSPPAIAARVDHLILGVRDLEEGIRQFEARTGVRPAIGGEHPGRGTRNALASLGDGHYVEILAPQAGAPGSERVDALRGLADLTPVGWAVAVRDLESARARLGAAGFTLSDVMPGSRARPDGSLLEWRTFEIAKPPIAGA